MTEYVELHAHSCFSFREGASTPLELVLQARSFGYEAMAVTDHDNLAGAMEFARAAKEWGLKPITGAEVTLRSGHHLTLLCETQRGYGNLCRLLTQANLSNPRGQPVVDLEALAKHADGLIALSGCRRGEVASLVSASDLRGARVAADRYSSIFGKENFWIELQNNHAFEDWTRNQGLVGIAVELGLGYVATNNVHYHAKQRHRLHDVLVAIRNNTTLEEARPLLRPTWEHHLKAPAEMARLFADLPKAISNSGLIAARCTFNVSTDLTYRFPDYVTGDGRSADDFLHDLCFQRAREVYIANYDVAEPKIHDELALIKTGRRAGFFLRLWELLRVAHERDLPVRGRGSSVGSVVCYLLGLSGIDPIKYDLFVGRFLNEARLEEDVPDIDLDFGRKARDEMFRMIFAQYGTEHAAQVCNFIEYRSKSAVRDVGKALGLQPADLDRIAKHMGSRFAGSLRDELSSMPEFVAHLDSPIWRDFLGLVDEIKGLPRHLSQHSGGVIISTTRMDEQVPVERPAMEGRYIAQWDKDSVADAGFIKLDLLAYPTLDQLYRGLRYIAERHAKVISPNDIPLDDDAVYEMIRRGDVIGIVQIQSRAQRQVLLRINISNIHDLVIQVALIRPGPIQGGAVNPYIARCLGHEPVTYDHPSLEPFLAETKGVFIFQEQTIQASMAVAGFTSGQAEMLRRAMSRKRSREAMEALREAFLEGAGRNGIAASTASQVYEKIMAFAEFGFPKSHAAAMAETACKVAWMKHYYPVEFYTALLNEQPMGFYSPEVICGDARRHDIEILVTDVNHSRSECTIERQDAIRMGFRYVKGLGKVTLERLDLEASNGPYRSLRDFWQRTRLQREAIENLIHIGAFSWTGLHERELFWQLGAFYQPLNAQAPLSLITPDDGASLPEMSHRERVLADLSLLGIAIRGRSMDLVADHLHEGIATSRMVSEMPHGAPVTVAGLVAVRQAPQTAKGFVFHMLEDYYGHVDVITNPKLVPKYRHLIESAPALVVHGHIERQERAVNVMAEHFEALPVTGMVERRVHSFG